MTENSAWAPVIFGPGYLPAHDCHSDSLFRDFNDDFRAFQNKSSFVEGSVAVYECFEDFMGLDLI